MASVQATVDKYLESTYIQMEHDVLERVDGYDWFWEVADCGNSLGNLSLAHTLSFSM